MLDSQPETSTALLFAFFYESYRARLTPLSCLPKQAGFVVFVKSKLFKKARGAGEREMRGNDGEQCRDGDTKGD